VKLLDHITRIGDAVFVTYEVAIVFALSAVLALIACLFITAGAVRGRARALHRGGAMTAARRAVRGSAAKPKKERIWVELLVATIADPIMGVEREKYSLQSSLTDGESVQLQIPRGDTYFDIRLSPDAARSSPPISSPSRRRATSTS
jgi:hypothetical protein